MDEQKLVDTLTGLISDKETQIKIKQSLEKHRPQHWSRLANAPYYRAKYAAEIKIILDQMIADGENRVIFYKDHPGLNSNTLYNKLFQAKKYLLDKLDPDGKYSLFCESLHIHKKRGVGIHLDIDRNILDGTPEGFKAQTLSNTNSEEWKSKIEIFIKNSQSGDVLHMKNLALSPEEIEDIEITLFSLNDIMYNIKCNEIKLIKE